MHYNKKIEGLTERLNSAINASGMTNGEIIKKVGVPRTTYYGHLEGQSMGEIYVMKYCRALGISADWLLGLRKERCEMENEGE